MARKRSAWPDGELVVVEHDSAVLADNPLGDPARRRFPVWLPPGYSGHARRRRYPVLFDLTGYTGSGWSHTNWRNFDENVPERLARLVHQRRMRPCIVAFPDCFTALGGNQYVNSSAIGRYADYLTRELVPFIDQEFRTLADRDHRGCFGKSSGGYGALVHGMKYPRCWGAVASHSGDVYFDFIYRSEWPAALTELGRYRHPPRHPGAWRPAAHDGLAEGLDDGRVARFIDSVWQRERLSGTEITTLMMVCMAATYDPDPEAANGFRLPFHLETGELLPERWRVWLRHDPLRLVGRYARNLGTLRGLYLDCGWRDQYHIHFGTRMLSQKLHAAGIDHVYEEFDGTHSGVDHRMDVSLPYLSRVLG